MKISLVQETGDRQAGQFLRHRLGIAIVQGDLAPVLSIFPQEDGPEQFIIRYR